MRLYHGCPSPANMTRARGAAPSHVHGACWTPHKMTGHDWPYFVDNGAYTSSFDRSEWLDTLDRIPEKMPHPPDFVVLPDAYNDANETMSRHREHVQDVLDRGYSPAPVLQPGLDESMQIRVYAGMGADTLFVGGRNDWKQAFGQQMLDEAHKHGLRVHVGNPGGHDEMLWWAKAGADSMDTSSILQNQYFHWLESLEGLSNTPRKKGTHQVTLADGAGTDLKAGDPSNAGDEQ